MADNTQPRTAAQRADDRPTDEQRASARTILNLTSANVALNARVAELEAEREALLATLTKVRATLGGEA